jgi:hypothetical protein
MPNQLEDPRERAARALCRLAGDPEDIKFYGRPMWMNYLREVDAVLKAVEIEQPREQPDERTISGALKNLARAVWRRIGRS